MENRMPIWHLAKAGVTKIKTENNDNKPKAICCLNIFEVGDIQS